MAKSPFDIDPAAKSDKKPKTNPSRKRLEGFRKWNHELPRQHNERRLHNVLGDLVDYLGITGTLKEQRVIEIWPKTVGEKIASVTRVRSIKDGVLVVEVANSAWRQELTYSAPEILAKLNRTIGQSLVKRIRFA